MRLFSYYDVIIFDCDGVLFDSNDLKIEALGKALQEFDISSIEVEICKSYFAENFGKSRFHHIDYFVENFLNIDNSDIENFKEKLLKSYSEQCKKLYLTADTTPFSEKLLTKSRVIKYVASGSEEGELIDAFQRRGLDAYFVKILGSPVKKTTHVANILKENILPKAVMVGDAISDLEAAKDNNIDFVFYSPFSNVELKMRELCFKYNYRVIESFEEVLKEI